MSNAKTFLKFGECSILTAQCKKYAYHLNHIIYNVQIQLSTEFKLLLQITTEQKFRFMVCQSAFKQTFSQSNLKVHFRSLHILIFAILIVDIIFYLCRKFPKPVNAISRCQILYLYTQLYFFYQK